MKQFVLLLILILTVTYANAQVIRGTVTDSKGGTLPGANVYLKGSYDGTIADADGKFEFKTSLTGKQTLVVSNVGFQNFETILDLAKGGTYKVDVELTSISTQLNEVVITAGTFEASDKKRNINMKALDILTTANTNGDVFAGMNTLPGAQIVGEEGALFVRGGEKNETKTFVDGMLVSNPYTSKVPDLPMRGRFSPSLFSGVSFSTGGYSAEYGQALSSALILETQGFPTKTLTSLSFLPFGGGINQTWKGDSSSFSGSLDYHNMQPYYAAVKSDVNWQHSPEGLESTMMYRNRVGKSGLIKSFGSFSTSRLGLGLPVYLSPSELSDNLKLSNSDAYMNTVYTGQLSPGWTLKAGAAFNIDDEFVAFNHFSANTFNRVAQLRATIQNTISPKLMVKFGGEFDYQHYKLNYIQKDTGFSARLNFESPITAAFAEAEWKVCTKLFARIGSRLEYSGLNRKTSLVPRVSMAYKTGEYSQISMAYGIFSQLPKDEYLRYNNTLANEQATHYILNYQYNRNKRLFRVEGYYKDYKNLVRFDSANYYLSQNYRNGGHGYARGIEFFYRDQKTLRFGDYWISYSYLDTKKLYQDFTSMQTPGLFSKHNLSVVGKYFVSPLRTQFGLTYQFNSGRPIYNDYEHTNNGYTKDYHNLSVNASYLVSLFKCFTIIHLSVTNVLGFDQVFGYHFVKDPNVSNGATPHYITYPIKPQMKRFIIIGIFMTLDKNYVVY
jgi:Outer membrane receptor for ferrienterochelin and colicins